MFDEFYYDSYLRSNRRSDRIRERELKQNRRLSSDLGTSEGRRERDHSEPRFPGTRMAETIPNLPWRTETLYNNSQQCDNPKCFVHARRSSETKNIPDTRLMDRTGLRERAYAMEEDELEKQLFDIAKMESIHDTHSASMEKDDVKEIKEEPSGPDKTTPNSTKTVFEQTLLDDIDKIFDSDILLTTLNTRAIMKHVEKIILDEIKINPDKTSLSGSSIDINTTVSVPEVKKSKTSIPTESDVPIKFNESHIDFVIGRGKKYPTRCLNIPINNFFDNRNIIYIDPIPEMGADINSFLHDVDFSSFGICYDQDPECLITIRFIFDWSSFYCGALQNLSSTIKKIGRKCQIFVPLSTDEKDIPQDVKNEISKTDIFKIDLVDGQYPLFDWSKTIRSSNSLFSREINISEYVNPNKYMIINAYSK